MSTYNWYKLLNVTEFEADDIPSRQLTLELDGVGTVEVMVTNGALIGILYADVFLPVNMNDNNPFEFEGHAAYVDANQDLFLGIESA